MRNFEINVLEQYWIDKIPNNVTDLCSHGLLSIKVNDVIITGEHDKDWTLSTAGLTLLRTLNNNFISENNHYPLIQHCGQLGMIGCPIHITWDVFHNEENVVLKNFEKLLTTNENDVISFKNLEITLPIIKYRREVVRFADSIKNFFIKAKKEILDNYTQNEYESFWNEFDRLLENNRKKLHHP